MISSDQTPPASDWLVRRVTDLERQVRELQAGRRLENATIGAGGLKVKGGGGVAVQDGGGITVEGGGQLIVRGGALRASNSEGVEQVYVGPISVAGAPAGTGFIFRRFTGEQVFGLEGADPEHQYLAVRDAEGNIIFSDDAGTGQGLARPWLPVTWAGSDFTQWPGTTSGSFASVVETAIPRQQPKLFVRVRHTTDVSGTTGELRLMAGGGQLGATIPVGFIIGTTDLTVDLPSGNHGDVIGMAIDGRRTAGTGAVRAMVTASWTKQS